MKVPFWAIDHKHSIVDAQSTRFYDIEEDSDEWTRRPRVNVTSWEASRAALTAAKGRLHNVRWLRLFFMGSEDEEDARVLSVLLDDELPNLRCLEIQSLRSEAETQAVAKVLRRQRQIEHLAIQITGSANPSVLFDAMMELPLIALSLFVGTFNAFADTAERVCELLRKKGRSLLSLGLVFGDEGFFQRVAQGFDCPSLIEISVASFCAAPLNAYSILFSSLKNCRLEFLEFGGQYPWQELESSGLLEQGWLLKVLPVFRSTDQVQAAVARNQSRHRACRRLCVVFVAIRKTKRALTHIPLEIVVVIAQHLLETRNQEAWDVVC